MWTRIIAVLCYYSAGHCLATLQHGLRETISVIKHDFLHSVKDCGRIAPPWLLYFPDFFLIAKKWDTLRIVDAYGTEPNVERHVSNHRVGLYEYRRRPLVFVAITAKHRVTFFEHFGGFCKSLDMTECVFTKTIADNAAIVQLDNIALVDKHLRPLVPIAAPKRWEDDALDIFISRHSPVIVRCYIEPVRTSELDFVAIHTDITDNADGGTIQLAPLWAILQNFCNIHN